MDKNEKYIRANLANELLLVESALSDSYNNLQMVCDDGLIDYYTYKIKADEARHKYLLDKIRNLDI
jgi:hypothetical protein